MARIDSLKIDCERELNGVWIDYFEGVRVKIARARNTKYQEVLRNLLDPMRDAIRKEDITSDKFNDVLLQVRARTVLLDWKNIEDVDGKPIPYSAEKAEEFFRDPELKDFYTFVVMASENADNYKKTLVQESEKNS